MGKLKNNQDGFGTLELILILVIVVLIGVVGWFVYDRNQNKSSQNTSTTATTTPKTTTSTNIAPTSTKFSLQTKLTSHSKAFSFYIPDGWIVTNDNTLDYGHAIGLENLTYKKGSKGIVLNKPGLRGDGPTVSNFIFQEVSKTDFDGYFDNMTKAGTITTSDGVEGQKYTFTLKKEDDMVSGVGSMSYGYSFVHNSKYYVFNYMQAGSDPNMSNIVEETIKTLHFNN